MWRGTPHFGPPGYMRGEMAKGKSPMAAHPDKTMAAIASSTKSNLSPAASGAGRFTSLSALRGILASAGCLLSSISFRSLQCGFPCS